MLPNLAILTALPKEHSAVARLLRDSSRVQVEGDPTIYTVGDADGFDGMHSVVLACQSKYANNLAAVAATNVARSFPDVSDIVFVGIAAGVPRPDKPSAHVRLGDVVVSSGRGVVQFDLGAHTPTGFEVRDTSPPPSSRLLQAVNMLESEMGTERFSWVDYLSRYLLTAGVRRPRREPARDFAHPRDPDRVSGVPRILRGKIGASNAVIRDAKVRDSVAHPLGLIALEMEGSGIADAAWDAGLGYLLIRSAADYGDQRKSDEWQNYAAHVAAAYLGALLGQLPSGKRDGRFAPPSRQQTSNPRASTSTGLARSVEISGNRLTCCAWKADEHEVYFAGFDRALHRYQPLGEPNSLVNVATATIRAITPLPSSDWLVAGDDAGRLTAIRPTDGTSVEVGARKSAIYSLATRTRTNALFAAERSGSVTVWGFPARQPHGGSLPHDCLMFHRVVHEHRGAAFGIRHDGLRDRCVSVGEDGILRSTELQSGRTHEQRLCDSTLFALAVSTALPMVAAAGSEGVIWLTDGEGETRTLRGHGDAVRSLDLSPSAIWLASSSKDGTLRLWHLSSGQVWVLVHATDYLYELEFSRSGRRLAAVDGSGRAWLVDFDRPIDAILPHDIEELLRA